ncbi:TIGR04222 domain-containing membrane protein [Streptomyces sp. NPDC059378]|uniref:TIGR04222 domain-containing membrane protein n=1 Tax=Streptomyces sp. NPDC059378 TaxID=3346815 RepID=UPI003681DE1F
MSSNGRAAARTTGPAFRSTSRSRDDAYGRGRTRATQSSNHPLKTAAKASTGPAGGHILLTRGLPARGRRAPQRGWAMDSAAPSRLEPHAIALLRGGPRAAVTVAVLSLHLRGAVQAGRVGTMRTTGPAADRSLPPLTRAVHAALYRPAGMGQLMDRKAVRQALAGLRGDLRAAGLLRAFPPGRTHAARTLLRTLRAEHPLPAQGTGLPAEDQLIAVALYGDRALTAVAPRFAREAGLTGRGGTTERDLPTSWGSGGGGGDTGGCGTA